MEESGEIIKEGKESRDTCFPAYTSAGTGAKHLGKKRDGNGFFSNYDKKVTSKLKTVQLSSRTALSERIFCLGGKNFLFGWKCLHLHCPVATSHIWLSWVLEMYDWGPEFLILFNLLNLNRHMWIVAVVLWPTHSNARTWNWCEILKIEEPL